MSDIVDRLKRQTHLEHIGGFSGGLFEQAADEIESLRDECVQLKQGYTSLRSDMDRVSKTAKGRIEELEENRDAWKAEAIKRAGGAVHGITTEQIDAAWEMSEEGYIDEDVLRELGIERCEGCGGSGEVSEPADHDQTVLQTDVCPDCNGHGWKKIGGVMADIDRSFDEDPEDPAVLKREIERLRGTLREIANDGCGMARIKDNRTLWCSDLYEERDKWCWCCIAHGALENK